jgi:hypothetical protein
MGGPYANHQISQVDPVAELLEVDRALLKINSQVMTASRQSQPIHPAWFMTSLSLHA